MPLPPYAAVAAHCGAAVANTAADTQQRQRRSVHAEPRRPARPGPPVRPCPVPSPPRPRGPPPARTPTACPGDRGPGPALPHGPTVPHRAGRPLRGGGPGGTHRNQPYTATPAGPGPGREPGRPCRSVPAARDPRRQRRAVAAGPAVSPSRLPPLGLFPHIYRPSTAPPTPQRSAPAMAPRGRSSSLRSRPPDRPWLRRWWDGRRRGGRRGGGAGAGGGGVEIVPEA